MIAIMTVLLFQKLNGSFPLLLVKNNDIGCCLKAQLLSAQVVLTNHSGPFNTFNKVSLHKGIQEQQGGNEK